MCEDTVWSAKCYGDSIHITILFSQCCIAADRKMRTRNIIRWCSRQHYNRYTKRSVSLTKFLHCNCSTVLKNYFLNSKALRVFYTYLKAWKPPIKTRPWISNLVSDSATFDQSSGGSFLAPNFDPPHITQPFTSNQSKVWKITNNPFILWAEDKFICE